MTVNSDAAGAPVQAGRALGPHYKWIALSNTTLGMLMATINQSIVLIALPDIFRGIGLNPLSPGNTSYLLWMFMGFLVVSAVLVVSFGRLGDMFGRVRMYTLGFAVFSIASIFLTVTWMHGSDGALWLIIWRVVQGIGGAFLFANAAAIVTDAFPANQRGTALSVNSIAAIAGSFIGLILGGVLAPVNWHLIFLVSAPIGVFGTVWAYFMLHDIGMRKHAQMDWWGNLLFAAGLVAILVGITYGLLPYGGHPMGWTNPWVLTALFGGLALLVIFVFVETKVAEPLFRISLFKIRAFTAGNIASMMLALGRGGMQFMLIIWLQGIWLPLHGYDFSQTPLWAGIYLVPLTTGFLVAAPLSGILSDKFGPKAIHSRRRAADGSELPAADIRPGGLRLLGVRDRHRPQRLRLRPVLLAELGGDDELGPARQARGGWRHDRHLPELRVRAVDRHLLHPDGGRPVKQTPGGHVRRADRAGRPGRHGRADLAPPPDRRTVCLLPRLQPDAATARPAAASSAPGTRGLLGRAGVFPAPDHGTVPQRSRCGLRVRHRSQRDRGRRLGADRRRTPAPAGHESLGYELAAVAGEGGFEPSELVVPGVPEQSTEPPDRTV